MEPDTPETASNDPFVDHHIQTVARMANLGITRGITLTTAAGLITGTVIGGEEFHELYIANFVSGMSEETKSALSGTFEDWKAPYKDLWEEEKEPGFTAFIHLRDARFFFGTGWGPEGGVLWRGRIDQIIGFSLGTFN